jgi:hypothetical protein
MPNGRSMDSKLIPFPCRIRYQCPGGDVVAVWDTCPPYGFQGYWIEDAQTGKRLTPRYWKSSAEARMQLAELINLYGGEIIGGER